MLDFSRILVPVDLEQPSLAAIHHAAGLARRFHSELLILHVISRLSYLGLHSHGYDDQLSGEIKQAEAKLDSSILPGLAGLSARRAVVRGNPAHLIPRIAQDEKQGLIVMGTHGYGAVAGALMGSVTAGVLDGAHVPVWTTAPAVQSHSDADAQVRTILCAVDFGHSDKNTTQEAAEVARLFGAKLILAHVTPSVENYGPGGSHVLPEFKEALVNSSTRQLTKLRDEMGVEAEFFIGSGSVPKVLAEAAKQTSADLLIIGRRASINRLGANNYGIIRDSPIAVLSV